MAIVSRELVGLTLVALALAGCGSREAVTYTLYRNSIFNENERLHVATFDADADEGYNKGNCEIAQQLFQSQPVKTKFWCEKGRFKK